MSEVYIIGSAIKTGKSMTVGLRHSDCYRVIESIYGDLSESEEYEHVQGFLTSRMKFVTRGEALKIVLNNTQKTRTHRNLLKNATTLISENLW